MNLYGILIVIDHQIQFLINLHLLLWSIDQLKKVVSISPNNFEAKISRGLKIHLIISAKGKVL